MGLRLSDFLVCFLFIYLTWETAEFTKLPRLREMTIRKTGARHIQKEGFRVVNGSFNKEIGGAVRLGALFKLVLRMALLSSIMMNG